jgi:addiction module RelE/StbE family toxin
VAEVLWSPQAVSDVESIRAYIERDSHHYASLVVARIIAAVERAGEFPASGRVVPEVGDATLREIVWRSYRIVYRVRDARVEVVTVFHGAMLFPGSPGSG